MFKFFKFSITTILIFLSFSLKSKDEVNDVLKYLSQFHSLQTDFIQINNNGSISSGKIFLKRPGKIRIEYKDQPLLIISDGKKIATINSKLKNISFYSLKDVPLRLLLFHEINKEKINIEKLTKKENFIKLRLTEKSFEDRGYIELIFEDEPFQMKKWTIFKNDKSKTEILLNNLQLNIELTNNKFDISSEDPRNPLWRN